MTSPSGPSFIPTVMWVASPYTLSSHGLLGASGGFDSYPAPDPDQWATNPAAAAAYTLIELHNGSTHSGSETSDPTDASDSSDGLDDQVCEERTMRKFLDSRTTKLIHLETSPLPKQRKFSCGGCSRTFTKFDTAAVHLMLNDSVCQHPVYRCPVSGCSAKPIVANDMDRHLQIKDPSHQLARTLLAEVIAPYREESQEVVESLL